MEESIEQINKRESELLPLESGQHAVTPVPKTTTDLPFFYLTKRKDRLSKPIVYEGIDSEGRPMKWAATPNAAIGSPGIDAHETWTRLVKPTWEAYRTAENRLPNILPLGGVRQCLRVVGWGQGGWEARRLLRALNQIGATWCTADFSVPTSKLGEDGRPTYRLVKGAFSRLTIFAIGEKHLTEEELKEGKFDFEFNLEDTLYIQFHPFEVAIQESQPQRYLDNQYMFSVGASARRWYELMAAKIFGVVKNGGDFCEVLYSWYVKHHHTLNRLSSRRRIVQQINEVVEDHLDSKFLDRVEYVRARDPRNGIDFLIRFYPGSAAKQSVTRVASALQKKRTPPGGNPRVLRHPRKQDSTESGRLGVEASKPTTVQVANESLSGTLTNEPTASPEKMKLADALVERGLLRSPAMKLLSSLASGRLDQVQAYIEYWDAQRKVGKVTPGLLYELIRNGDPLPIGFETASSREARTAVEARQRNLARAEELVESLYTQYCRKTIDDHLAALPAGEFEYLVAARREETMRQAGFLGEQPSLAEQLARHEVRAAIAKTLPLLSAEEFRLRELSRVLAELNLKPTDVGLEVSVSEPIVRHSIAPEAVNGSPRVDESPDESSSIFEENYLQEAVYEATQAVPNDSSDHNAEFFPSTSDNPSKGHEDGGGDEHGDAVSPPTEMA